jgi:hypothetical protein
LYSDEIKIFSDAQFPVIDTVFFNTSSHFKTGNMKTNNFLRVLAVLASIIILAGCTKDSQITRNSTTVAKSVKLPTEFPVYINTGMMKGSLYPVPTAASLKVYNEKGNSIEWKPFSDGTFNIQNLPPDLYSIQIAYLVKQAEFSYWAYYQVDGVIVQANETTELGVINLPWSY